MIKSTKPKRQRVKRTRAGGQWTEARYWQFIRSLLRQGFQRYPVKQMVKTDNRRKVTGQRHKFEYLCAECGGWFKDKEVNVDHIVPAGSLKDYSDLPGFVKRLYCEADGLQILCKPCHDAKTAKERKGAKRSR